MNKFIRSDKKIKITGDLFFNGAPYWNDNEKISDTKLCLRDYITTLSKIRCTHTPIHVSNISKVMDTVIKKLDLEQEFFDRFKYECPFNNTNHCALVPVYLMCEDVEKTLFSKKLVRNCYKNMFMDKKYMFQLFDEDLDLDLIQTVRIGAGFTSITYPSDGCVDFLNYALELEDGNYLFCKMIVWYNC